jgi:metallophosphoesterase superfamily enzyme
LVVFPCFNFLVFGNHVNDKPATKYMHVLEFEKKWGLVDGDYVRRNFNGM